MDARDPTPAAPTPAPPPRRLLPLRALGTGVAVALLLAVTVEGYQVTVGGHVHEVIPGVLYRCGQPTPRRLKALRKKYGIRTVVNLRGCCDARNTSWYREESYASARLDLSQEDLSFSAGRLPSVPVVRHLVDVLDHSERPILVHCHQGVDRTGMTATMARLLYTDDTLDEALEQLGPRYYHLPLGRTGNIDRFFTLYREWLAAQGHTHTPDRFRRWVHHDYCPGECRAEFAVLEPRGTPLVMTANEPLAVRVRCTNTSVKPWRLRPGNKAGIHLFWQLFPADGLHVADGQAGLFHAAVAPGDSIDLTVALPPVKLPGRYTLSLDMSDEQHGRFHQFGPEPLVVEVEVR